MGVCGARPIRLLAPAPPPQLLPTRGGGFRGGRERALELPAAFELGLRVRQLHRRRVRSAAGAVAQAAMARVRPTGDEAAGQSRFNRKVAPKRIVRECTPSYIHFRTGRKIGNNVSFLRPSLSVLLSMTPAARISAAIEVLADIEARRRPATDALKDWGLSHRFAGSEDRAAIASLVYDALRRKSSAAWIMGEATPRAVVLGMLKPPARPRRSRPSRPSAPASASPPSRSTARAASGWRRPSLERRAACCLSRRLPGLDRALADSVSSARILFPRCRRLPRARPWTCGSTP